MAALPRRRRSTPSRLQRVSMAGAEVEVGEDVVHREDAAEGVRASSNSPSLLLKSRGPDGQSWWRVRLDGGGVTQSAEYLASVAPHTC